MPDTSCTQSVWYSAQLRSSHRELLPSQLTKCERRHENRDGILFALLLGLALFCLPAKAEIGDVSIIASPNVDASELSPADLEAIFLGRRRQWSDGTRIRIAILKSEEVQEAFLESTVDRTPRQYWAHWRNIVFSGRGTMPKIFTSEEMLLKYMTDQEGVIGLTTDLANARAQGASVLTIGGVN